MRGAGLTGASRRRKGVTTTRRDKDARPAPDLVDRDFTAVGRDKLWVADITFVPTANGFLYLAVVLDAWSRKIVSWSHGESFAHRTGSGRVGDGDWATPSWRRHPSLGSRKPIHVSGVRRAVAGRRECGHQWDRSAMPTTTPCARAFSPRWNCELLERRRSASQAEAKMACFSFIEGCITPFGCTPRWVTARRWHTKR